MFEPPPDRSAPPTPALSQAQVEEAADDGEAINTADYRPWLLRRGQTANTMLHLRRFEAKSGLWMGWILPYPNLYAAEYMGERLVNLDFGARQFMVEGDGLDGLLRYLQQGSVVTITEYARSIWPNMPDGAVIQSLRRISPRQDEPSV